MDERTRRLAENEAQFRDVNECIGKAAAQFGGAEHVYEFVCECSHADCFERVHLTVTQYRDVRQHPARFALVRGHDVPDIEDVVASLNGTVVVEKRGEAADYVAHRR